ncbi:MAG: peptide-methionine (R)-S-oxide reductase MsrB [Patescibacteria group bacterium]
MDEMPKTEEEWEQKLAPEEYRILREHQTEAPFSGEYVNNHEEGEYHCKGCGALLFTSDQKFDSGTGWPSFTDPAVAENVGTRPDDTYGMHRTEVYCKNCNGHLGHVFNDGPAEAGGKRYCINSTCLAFEKEEGRQS